MAGSYIPAKQSDQLTWMGNFSTAIANDPALYGLTLPDANAITNAYNDFSNALGLVLDPATRTGPTIAAKDDARTAALIVARNYAQLIQSNLGVSAEARVAAGLIVRATGRTPIPAPGTAPVLGFVGGSHGVLTLSFRDTMTPMSKAKPFGALQLELFVFVGPAQATDPATAKLVGLFTKSPMAVNFTNSDAGKFATFFGRWVTRRGLPGPWSAACFGIIM